VWTLNHLGVVHASSSRYEGGSHTDNTVGQGFKTATAGGIIVCVCNYLFLFIFGSEEGEPEATAEAKA